MPVRRVTHGGPLSQAHQLQITEPFGRDEIKALTAGFQGAARANTIDGRFAQFEGWAKTTLRTAGLPVDVRDARWTDELPRLEPYEAREWFAYQILLYARTIREDLAAERPELAVCAAVQWGRLSYAAQVKFALEKDTVRGLKNKRALEANRDGHNKQRQGETAFLVKRAKAIAAVHAGVSGGALEKSVQQELGPDPRTGRLISCRSVRRYLSGK